MPKAKKAVPRLRSHQINRKLTLDSATKEALVNYVGFQGNEKSIKRMIDFVEASMIQYHALLDMFNQPSIGSQIKSIEGIQKATLKLFRDIRDLELNVRIILFSDKLEIRCIEIANYFFD